MNFFQKKPTMEETLFQLRFTGKQLDKMAKKAEKAQEAEIRKVKKEIEAGPERYEFAQLYAENAIRKKNECLNYMRLSSRLDGVSSRLKTAQSMRGLTKDLGSVTKSLDSAMKNMNLEEVSRIMNKFESQFEDLDVQTTVMEKSMGSAMASSAPQDQISALIQQVADENGLEVQTQLDAVEVGTGSLRSEQAESSRDNELERRLRAMRSELGS